MKQFEIIEHTADIGIIAYGARLEDAFAGAACAMFTLIADLDGVEEKVSRQVEVQDEDREGLLVSWLNELLYLLDTENIIFKRFEIEKLTDTRLKAEAFGEPLDAGRHILKAGVKAATYYMLRVQKEEDGYSARVIFDV